MYFTPMLVCFLNYNNIIIIIIIINSIVMLAEQSLSWGSTTHWSHFSTTTQLLWLLDTQAKSEHSQAYIVLT